MKVYGFILGCLLFFVSNVGGDVWLDLYEPDGVTPYDGHDIMVGQSLVVVVTSDEAEYGFGMVVLENSISSLGMLSCRAPELMCMDSILPAAQGETNFAGIFDNDSPEGVGYGFMTDDEPYAGEWFIFDYTAMDVGDPNVVLYGPDFPNPAPVIIDRTINIHQVRSRDFDDDGSVNLGDFAILANHWLSTTCDEPDWCEQADLNQDHSVDILDLQAFVDFWLEETS